MPSEAPSFPPAVRNLSLFPQAFAIPVKTGIQNLKLSDNL